MHGFFSNLVQRYIPKWLMIGSFPFLILGIFLLWQFQLNLILKPTQAALTVPLVVSGTYIGNGSDDRAITGVGFQPDVVFVKGDAAVASYIRTSTMAGDASKPMTAAAGFSSNIIQSLDSDGFTIGTDSTVNQNGTTYYYVAMKQTVGQMELGTYSGDGNASQVITGIGFHPEYVVIMREGASLPIARSSTMSGSVLFSADAGTATNISSLNADGFTVGLSSGSNAAGNTYHYIAFNQNSGYFNVGTYTGNATDDRDITGAGFQSEFIIMHPLEGATADVFKAGSMPTNSAFRFNGNLSSYITDGIKAVSSDGFRVGTNGSVNANAIVYHWVAFSLSAPPLFEQSAYRFFSNADSADVDAALAAQDTQATLGAAGAAFRLRMLMHVSNDDLSQSGETFKLQYVGKGSGSCSSPGGGTPASYTDVTGATLIAFNNNATPADGATLTTNASDPTHTGHTVVAQTYEEADNFTNAIAAISGGQDGKWDFSLIDNGATASTSYCFRIVRSDSSQVLDTYSVYPEIITASGDVTAPTILNVTSSTANGSYKAGDIVAIQIQFSEAVVVSGTPQLTLETGASDAVVNYSSGSGTDTLVFNYTVSSGENSSDLEYVDVNSLNLNSGTIRDEAANNAVLTLFSPGAAGSLSANNNIIIDTVVPEFSSVAPLSDVSINNVTASSDAGYSLSENLASGSITVTQTGGTADPESPHTCTLVGTALNSGSQSINFSDTANGCSSVVTLVDGSIYTFTFDGQDAALNAATTVTRTNITFNTSAPAVTNVTSSTANGTYGEGENVSIQVEFDDAVTVTGTPQLLLETGSTDALVDYASGSETDILTFTYAVSAGENSNDLDYVDMNSLSLNGGTIKDAADNSAVLTLSAPGEAGSLSANKNIVIDTTAPEFSSVTPATGSSINNVTTASDVGHTLSENLASGTITITRSGGTADGGSPHTCTLVGTALASGAHTINFSDTANGCSSAVTLVDGSVYTFAFNGQDGGGTAASQAAVTNVIFDTTAPSVSNITSDASNGTYGSGQSLAIQVQFTETVLVTGTPQLTLETGDTDAVLDYASGSGTDTLSFNYSVSSGERSSDLDYVDTDSLSLNGGTIKDAAENNASVALPSPGAVGSLSANKNIIVDTMPQSLPSPGGGSGGSAGSSASSSSSAITLLPENSVDSEVAPEVETDHPDDAIFEETPDSHPSAPSEENSGNFPEHPKPVETLCANTVPSSSFQDIIGHWAETYILDLFNRCMVNGKMPERFGPDEFATRAEVTKLILNVFGIAEAPYEPIFADIHPEDWFFGYVLQAYHLNIVRGFSEKGTLLFYPDRFITRAEALAILLRTSGVDTSGFETTFDDVQKNDWFYPYVAYAQTQNILSGSRQVFEKSGPVKHFYVFSRNLVLGNTGKDVHQLKEILMQLDYFRGEMNGVFDVELANALRDYQMAKNISATGTFGSKTRALLLEESLEPKSLNFFVPYKAITRAELAKILSLLRAGDL